LIRAYCALDANVHAISAPRRAAGRRPGAGL